MSKELAKVENGLAINPKKLEGFSQKLHEEPHVKDVRINKLANNSRYIPIGVIETKLDELYFGLWQIRNFRWSVVANEIVGSLELGVFHPTAKMWIWREGAGSVLIQQKKGSDITDIGSKIKNTLQKDFPHLKSECLKNAAKSLGPIFGRDLNRDDDDVYEPVTEEIANADKAREVIDGIGDEKTLNEYLKQNPHLHTNNSVYNLIIEKRKALKNGSFK